MSSWWGGDYLAKIYSTRKYPKDIKLSYKDMVAFVEELSQRNICLDCGETINFENGKCPNCNKQYDNVQEASKNLNDVLFNIERFSLDLNELSIALYAIKDKFPDVNEILVKNNIEEKLLKKLDDINRILASGEVLQPEDDLFLRKCLENNIKPSVGLNDIVIFQDKFIN